MKKVILSLVVVGAALAFSSCKKCSTCTYKDPQRGTLTSEDVCQKGKAYKHSIDYYKERGWSCTEK